MTERELQTYIMPGIQPLENDLKRKRGFCIHHSYRPERPNLKANWAERFNHEHYAVRGFRRGLGYDFVLAWGYESKSRNSSSLKTKFWSSYRWVTQCDAAAALNVKSVQWADGSFIKPNQELIHICVVGDYDTSFIPRGVYLALGQLIADVKLMGVDPIIFGHSTFDYKTCPGKRFELLDIEAEDLCTSTFGMGIKKVYFNRKKKINNEVTL